MTKSGISYESRRNTPKSQRDRVVVKPVSPLSDPVKILGHPPRGRTGRGVRNRVT